MSTGVAPSRSLIGLYRALFQLNAGRLEWIADEFDAKISEGQFDCIEVTQPIFGDPILRFKTL